MERLHQCVSDFSENRGYEGGKSKLKREEFISYTKEIGIVDIEDYDIYAGKLCGYQYSEGVYFDDGKWFFYSVDERNNKSIETKETEDDAYDELLRSLWCRLRTNKAITREIVMTTRSEVVEFLCRKYSMEKQEANNAWDYLLNDFNVLNELKYFVVNNSFVPEWAEYVVRGYTAKKIHEETGLNELESFKRLVYFILNPQISDPPTVEELPATKAEKNVEKLYYKK